MIRRILVLIACAGLAGCIPHFKSQDSYGAMFRHRAQPQVADPYTFGGIGEGSGGWIPRQTYPSDAVTPDPKDVTAVGKAGYFGEDRTRTPDSLRKSSAPTGRPIGG